MDKKTVAIMKAGPWEWAAKSVNHPEYVAIRSLIQNHREEAKFLLLGTSPKSTHISMRGEHITAWDVQSDHPLSGYLKYTLDAFLILLRYRPHIVIVLGLNGLPVCLACLFSPRIRYTPIFIGEFNYYGHKRTGACLNRIFLRINFLFIRLTQHRINRMYALSTYTRNGVERMVPSFKGKIRLVSYPISPLFKRSNTKEKALGTPIIFTNVGIEPRKGIETLLKAAKLIPRKLKIVIKGSIRDPLYMQSLQELVKHYGLEKIHDIRFITSFVNYDQLVDYYNSSTLFVFPSREDCLGVTVLEALHCGLPVVATNVGGVPDMLEHGENSLLVPPDDPHKMAQAILNLLDNPELRTKLIENGCRVLENRFYTGRLTLEQAFEQSFLCAP